MSRDGHRDAAARAGGVNPAVLALQPRHQPVQAFAADYPAGHHIPEHFHPRAQLIHAAQGVMTVHTPAGAWLVPPDLALWMPPEIVHEVRAVTPISMRTLYIRPGAAPWLPAECRVVLVSPLLRELVLRAVTFSPDYGLEGEEGRLMAVILDQLRAMPEAPLHLPMPRDRRLRIVADALVRDPADARELAGWATKAGASTRTLARLFVKETGMTFAAWRQRRRLLAAVSRLAAGEPVTTVALDLGYETPSAFTAMFRRVLGAPPTRYLRSGGRDAPSD